MKIGLTREFPIQYHRHVMRKAWSLPYVRPKDLSEEYIRTDFMIDVSSAVMEVRSMCCVSVARKDIQSVEHNG